MTNKIWAYLAITLIIGLVAGYAITSSSSNLATNQLGGNSEQNNNLSQTAETQPQRNDCLSDDCLLVGGLEYPAGTLSPEVQTALHQAINDEYKALSTYEAVILASLAWSGHSL